MSSMGGVSAVIIGVESVGAGGGAGSVDIFSPVGASVGTVVDVVSLSE